MATRKSEQTERSRESAAEESESGPFTLADVRKLVDVLKGTDVTALVWKRGAEKVEIRRGPGAGSVAQVVTQAIPAAPVAAAPAAARPPPPPRLPTSPARSSPRRSSAPSTRAVARLASVRRGGHRW